VAAGELEITHDGSLVEMVSIMEFEDGRVIHETPHSADPLEPPLWRFRRARTES
jgi:hypothetical protein